jgi:hypothetical protein
MLDRSRTQSIPVDVDGIYADYTWWGGDYKPPKKKEPQYCKNCGHRLAEMNNSGECLRKCKPVKMEWVKPKPGKSESRRETGNPATYHGKPCRTCGGTERYIRGGVCKACSSRVRAERYRANKEKGKP